MTKVCHECHQPVQAGFGVISLVIRDTEKSRIAFSDLEAALCSTESGKLDRSKLATDPYELGEDIFYAIQLATGGLNPFTGSVPVGNSYSTSEQVIYLSRTMVEQLFPNCAKMFNQELDSGPQWAEKIDRQWQYVTWADALYERIKPMLTAPVTTRKLPGKT